MYKLHVEFVQVLDYSNNINILFMTFFFILTDDFFEIIFNYIIKHNILKYEIIVI